MSAVDLTVLGGRELTAKAAQLRREAGKLQRRISTAAGRAVDKTYGPALMAATPVYMPNRYSHLVAANLKVKTTVRYSGNLPGVTATVTAPTGGPKGRDVPALERGQLAHPLFGNKSHWYRNRIKRGFASDTLRKTRSLIVKELDSELESVRRDLEH